MVLRGTIIRTKYQKSDGSWHIVQFKIIENNVFTDEITATGYIPWTEDDDIIELEGEYKSNSFGDQFVVSQCWRVLPTTTKGIKKYLQEEIAGIGAGKANALAEHFGTKLIDVLNNSPQKLIECKGINQNIVREITNCWQRDGLAKKVGMFLAEHGISIVWKDRIVDKFGILAVEKITRNPYILTSINGIGFSKADEIAKKLGFKKTSEERIKASFLHVLDQWANDGHCFVHEGDLKEAVYKLTKAKQEDITSYLAGLIESKELVSSSLSSDGINIKVVYKPSLFEWEEAVSEKIVNLLGDSHKKSLKDSFVDTQFSDQQLAAIKNSFNNRLSIITGAPGTGKSSAVKGIVKLAAKHRLSLALCAPTGRASKRLTEITGEEASTIHRLLVFDGDSKTFRMDETNHLPYDMIIVDEASMIDLELANNLLAAIGPGTNIVFVGDIDQLPPVGPGSFLKDMIKSGKVVTTRLDQIFRQAQQSLMVQNSHRIKNGEYPVFLPKGSEADSYMMTKAVLSGDDSEWADSALNLMITKNIPSKIKELYNVDIDIKNDIQILVPMKKGTYGVHEVNKSLQKTLNADGAPFNAAGKVWRIGDKVLQNCNNYELDIYNGDIGIIKDYDVVDKTMTVDFDGKLTTIPYKTASDELSLGYALTIHKAQGSEYKVVVVVLLWQHYPMLERNLLYTANTRAKLMTLYIAAGGTIQKAVDTNKVKSRNSLLGHRIKSDYAKKFNNPLPSGSGQLEVNNRPEEQANPTE